MFVVYLEHLAANPAFARTFHIEVLGAGEEALARRVDSEDYLQPGVKAIVHNILKGARPGGIVLMHDAGGDRSQTLRALPAIIRGLRRRGYRLVTVPRLVLDDPPPRDQPLPEKLGGG